MKLKKWLLIAGVAVLGVGLVGTGAVKKYAAYAQQRVKTMLDDNADPKDEIERLKAELKELEKSGGDIKNAMAKEINQANKLEAQRDKLIATIAREDEATLAFADSIKAAEASKPNASRKISLGKEVMGVDEAKRRLQSDLDVLAARKVSLESMKTAVSQRQEAIRQLEGQKNEIELICVEFANELKRVELDYQALEWQALKNKNYKDEGKVGEFRASLERLKDKSNEKKIRIGLDTSKGKVENVGGKSVDDMLADHQNKTNPKSGD